MQAVQRTAPAFVKANGLELCYDTFGDPTGPAMILIMGLATQMIAWDEEFCAILARHGFYVVRFDNRDIGLSTRLEQSGVPDVQAAFMAVMQGKPITAPYSLSDMADDVVGLMDALGIRAAHIVGASMGGAIAQTVTIDHPERVLSLTSIMSTSGAPGLPPPTPEALAMLFKQTPTDEAGYLASYAETYRVLRVGSFPLDEARDRSRATQNFSRGLNPPGVARQLVAVLASGSRKEALGAVRAPTLVIHGDVDPLVPLACGLDVAASVPGAKLLVVEGMGHALPISMWPQVTDAIAAHAKESHVR